MEIKINDQQKVFAIQKEFSDLFPFLKLEFYSKSHAKGGAPSQHPLKHISQTIGECRTVRSSDHIIIQPQMTVAEIAQGFRDVYGLSIEVFCKSADTWTGIAENTDLTLERHNEEAKEFNKQARAEA